MPSANAGYTDSVRALMDLFGKLPGVGARSAERMAFHILKSDNGEALALADAIRAVKTNVRHCSTCFNLTESDPCGICRDPSRDHATICVVEQPKDLLQLESTGVFRGVYHVLLGHLAPLEGVGPGELTIDALVERVKFGMTDHGKVAASGDSATTGERTEAESGAAMTAEQHGHASPPITEIILGTNPTMEGDGTGLYLQSLLAPLGVRITRLARGLPAGAQIEHSNRAILSDALNGRTLL